MVKNIIMFAIIVVLFSGCATSKVGLPEVMILNERISKIEKDLDIRSRNAIMPVKPQSKNNLNEAQKDFAKWMLEYLAGRK